MKPYQTTAWWSFPPKNPERNNTFQLKPPDEETDAFGIQPSPIEMEKSEKECQQKFFARAFMETLMILCKAW